MMAFLSTNGQYELLLCEMLSMFLNVQQNPVLSGAQWSNECCRYAPRVLVPRKTSCRGRGFISKVSLHFCSHEKQLSSEMHCGVLTARRRRHRVSRLCAP
jgi:hypothetical protein